jgi:hypothetical protein
MSNDHPKPVSAPHAVGVELSDEQIRVALEGLLRHVDRETCTHESTHRGGAIWTICDDCGRKWADDRGGFKPYEDPPAVAFARALLASSAPRPMAAQREAALRFVGAAGPLGDPDVMAAPRGETS